MSPIPQETFTVTRPWLEANATKGLGFTKLQTDCLGVPHPLKAGWKNTVIGKMIPIETAREFERLHAERQAQVERRVQRKSQPEPDWVDDGWEDEPETFTRSRAKLDHGWEGDDDQVERQVQPDGRAVPSLAERQIEATYTRLYAMLKQADRITRKPSRARWMADIRELRQHRTPLQISEALDWLENNLNDKWTPDVWSASSFCEKFPRIVAAMNRSGEQW